MPYTAPHDVPVVPYTAPLMTYPRCLTQRLWWRTRSALHSASPLLPCTAPPDVPVVPCTEPRPPAARWSGSADWVRRFPAPPRPSTPPAPTAARTPTGTSYTRSPPAAAISPLLQTTQQQWSHLLVFLTVVVHVIVARLYDVCYFGNAMARIWSSMKTKIFVRDLFMFDAAPVSVWRRPVVCDVTRWCVTSYPGRPGPCRTAPHRCPPRPPRCPPRPPRCRSSRRRRPHLLGRTPQTDR